MDDTIIDDELFKSILKNCLLTLNIKEDDEDYDYLVELISLYINMACQKIIILTNRKKFPIPLRFLVIDMVNDMYNAYKYTKTAENNDNIKSMTETDRSITFGLDSSLQTMLNNIINNKLNENKSLINRFRLVYKL